MEWADNSITLARSDRTKPLFANAFSCFLLIAWAPQWKGKGETLIKKREPDGKTPTTLCYMDSLRHKWRKGGEKCPPVWKGNPLLPKLAYNNLLVIEYRSDIVDK